MNLCNYKYISKINQSYERVESAKLILGLFSCPASESERSRPALNSALFHAIPRFFLLNVVQLVLFYPFFEVTEALKGYIASIIACRLALDQTTHFRAGKFGFVCPGLSPPRDRCSLRSQLRPPAPASPTCTEAASGCRSGPTAPPAPLRSPQQPNTVNSIGCASSEKHLTRTVNHLPKRAPHIPRGEAPGQPRTPPRQTPDSLPPSSKSWATIGEPRRVGRQSMPGSIFSQKSRPNEN